MAEKMTLEEALAKAQTYTVMHGKSGQYPDGSGWGHAWNEEGMWLPRKAWAVIYAHLTQPAQAVDVTDEMVQTVWDVAAKSAVDDLHYRIRDKRALRRGLEAAITRALGDAQAEGWKVPEGWALVPVEANLEMRIAGGTARGEANRNGSGVANKLDAIFKAMAEASPTPPQPEE